MTFGINRGSSLFFSRAALVLSATGFWGCGGGDKDQGNVDISAIDAALTARENTERALKGLLDSGGFAAESSALADSLSAMSGSTESCTGVLVTPVCPDGTTGCDTTPVTQEECVTEPNDVTVNDLVESRQDLHDALDDLLAALENDILSQNNLESEDATQVTYLLGSDVLCGEQVEAVPVDSSAPPEPSIDESCAEQAARLSPRLRLTSPSEGDIDLSVLLTAQRRNPVSFELYHDRLGVVVDLGELYATLQDVGEPIEGISTLLGQLGAEVVQNASLDYSLRFNVLEDLEVVAGDAGDEITVTLARSVPTAELRFDGNARTITGTSNFGAFNLAAPLGSFFSDDEEAFDDLGNPIAPKSYTGILDILVGGLNSSLTFDGNTDVISFAGLGLGDVSSTAYLDDELLMQLDVNPDQGRRFDVEVAANAGTNPTLTFSPTLDLQALFAFEHLADQVEDIEPFLLDDQVRLWFDGENPSIRPEDNQVRVMNGTLHLSSESAPDTAVDVPSGMCLLSNEGDGSGSPSALTAAFVAGACSE